MKLRNKKTGEITTRIDVSESGEKFWVLGKKPCMYDTLAELNAEWEDYKPKQPLIKDEKVCQVVRGWADYNGVEEAFYFTYGDGRSRLDASTAVISFYNELRDLKEWKKYTIAELCGKEKE